MHDVPISRFVLPKKQLQAKRRINANVSNDFACAKNSRANLDFMLRTKSMANETVSVFL